LYSNLEAIGPEHEYAIIDEDLTPLPITDRVIEHLNGRIGNNANLSKTVLSKELQCHVAELKPQSPFISPKVFEKIMHESVLEITELLKTVFDARLLGTGMHPTIRLEQVRIWPHEDKEIYNALDQIFDIRQHGWLNIQAYQLNLSYGEEQDAIQLYNTLANILPYLPAISAASPIYENRIGDSRDNRLRFYNINQKEIPSITGKIIPEYIDSFQDYRETTIERYSRELQNIGASPCIIGKEWINSRGAIIRFDRRAIEIRILDEQECIKADVAITCFIRAILRGLLEERVQRLPLKILIGDYKTVIRGGLDAEVQHPRGPTARDVCRHLYKIAEKNSDQEEKEYLQIAKKIIEEGNLSDRIIRNIEKNRQRTDIEEAILKIYLELSSCLEKNQIYQ